MPHGILPAPLKFGTTQSFSGLTESRSFPVGDAAVPSAPLPKTVFDDHIRSIGCTAVSDSTSGIPTYHNPRCCHTEHESTKVWIDI